MSTAIRIYEHGDYNACRALWVELTQRHREIYEDPGIGGDDPGKGFDAYLANPNRRATWVAELDGKVVGIAGLICHGEEAEVEPVVVTAVHRSQGIGRSLVDHAVGHAREMGVRFLNVRPVARNAEAISFFVEAGFNLIGHVDLFQDLSPSAGRQWKPGIVIHGKSLRY